VNLRARLDRLEASTPEGRAVIVWRELGETAEQALVRHFGPGPRPANTVVIGWSDTADTATPGPALGGEP
jgi:hypothetical protein